jgi:hypothetical protein
MTLVVFLLLVIAVYIAITFIEADSETRISISICSQTHGPVQLVPDPRWQWKQIVISKGLFGRMLECDVFEKQSNVRNPQEDYRSPSTVDGKSHGYQGNQLPL